MQLHRTGSWNGAISGRLGEVFLVVLRSVEEYVWVLCEAFLPVSVLEAQELS